jgi:BirA family biotin operon repressor/biotin-[acetyl-CoA-carboxylase] ligase
MSFDADAALRAARAAGWSWPGVIHGVEVTSSTQDLARQAAAQGAPQGATFVAEEQTQGRGRQGRPWVAPRGSALLASVLLRPELEIAALPPLALVVGLALHDALAPLAPGGALRIKWPNDLLLDGRKVAGVLIESSLRGARVDGVVVGFGVNLRQGSLPPEIPATSLQRARPGLEPLRREDVLAAVLVRMEQRIAAYLRGGLATLLEPLRAADGTAGRQVAWQGGVATVRAIGDDGQLVLETATGPVAVAAGEVLFLPSSASLSCATGSVALRVWAGEGQGRCSTVMR